ncbi:MAG: hypothetical protein IJD91_05160 [Clostridia bacterium]|nr:hypothetical protein [Clostridia bacterium]
MNEKTKNILMKELYKGAVALAILIVVFALCSIFPDIKTGTKTVLIKDTDLKKVISLFLQIAKEIVPFR